MKKYRHYKKKELIQIADLMLQIVQTKPDKSELSAKELFEEVVRGKKVKRKDNDDVHDKRIWNFPNSFYLTYKQEMELDSLFVKKAAKAGYIVDGSWKHGLRIGLLFWTQRIFRLRSNLISSFNDKAETEISKGDNIRYYIRKQYETVRENDEHNYYNLTRELQLWRIPVGKTTGVISNESGRVTCYVLNGKCSFENSHWEYIIFIDDDNENTDEATWKEYKETENLSIYKFGFARCNKRREETKAPQTAWYKITNTGKSDLLLYVVDAFLY